MAQKATVPPFTVINGSKQIDSFAPSFFSDQYKRLTSEDNAFPEAYIVQSESLFFYAIVHTHQDNGYCCTGQALFASGDHLGFTTKADNRSEVADKCETVAARLAKCCNGLLQKGVIDSSGCFHDR